MTDYGHTEKAEIYGEILDRCHPDYRRAEVIWMAKNLQRETVLKAVERFAKHNPTEGPALMEFAETMVSR